MKTIEEIKSTPKTVMKKPELLAPAGNLEKLKIAVHYGADAVFLGGQEYGLRSNADNFTMEEIAEGVEFANRYGAKIYVTTNIIAHDENIEGLESYLRNCKENGLMIRNLENVITFVPVLSMSNKEVKKMVRIFKKAVHNILDRKC